MARRTAIPLLLDVTRVDAPGEIRMLDAHPSIDRTLDSRGGLINRLRLRRLRNLFHVDHRPMPAFLPRDDPARAPAHLALAGQLDEVARTGAWDRDALGRLAAHVRGDGSDVGPAAQDLLGRLFKDDYVADEETWASAQLLDDYVRTNAVRGLWLRLTGRVDRARWLLWRSAGHDPIAIHATAIAVHNLVAGLDRMRALHADRERPDASEDEVLGRCLAAPAGVLRQVRAPLNTPAVARRLPEGALVVYEIEKAVRATGDRSLAFMADGWSRCPAAGLIPALLLAVWREARAGGGK
jgi:hypothetical protein